MKRLLLSASLMAILSTQVFATRQIVDSEVDGVLSRERIIERLFGSRDYTISISETDIAQSAFQRARRELDRQEEVTSGVVTQMTKEKISQNLNTVKNERDHIGGGYYATSNFQNDDLCVESRHNILVYPVEKQKREAPNAFLPATYASNKIGVELYNQVVNYVEDMGLSSREDETRLIRHISPLSYILQQEIDLMLKGGVRSNGTTVRGIADRPRWVYDDGYAGMLNHVKSQINHHFDMLVLSNLRGLDRNYIAENLTPSLLDNGLSLLTGSKFTFGDRTYVLGTGHRELLGIIHPDNGLLYPILADHRSKREQDETFPVGDMNLPQGFQGSTFLNKQWKRLDEFFFFNEGLNKNDQRRAKVLLEPVGYMVHSLLRDMQPDFSSLGSSDFVDFLALSFSEQQQRNFFNRLEPFIFANENISRELGNRLRNQITIHAAMTEDLWPSRFSNRERQADFALQAVNYLLYQELKEKLISAWPQRRDMLLEQEEERDNVLRLTQERLRTKESDLSRVQGLLQKSDREGQEKTRLVQEKENELNLAKETAKQEIKRLKDRLDEALDEQRRTEISLQEVRADADQAINLAQENVENARKTLLKAEQDLRDERKEGESLKEELLTFQKELNLAKDELLSAQEKAAVQIKEAEALIELANIDVLKMGQKLVDKEQLITQLSEEKEKVEVENKGLLTTIEQNTKAMYLMNENFNEFKIQFINKHNEVVSLKEDVRRLEDDLALSRKDLKNWRQHTFRLQKEAKTLSEDLEKHKERVEALKVSLEKEKEDSRLAQEELQKKYEGLLKNAKEEELNQLKLQHDEEVKELSKKFVALTQELESVQRERDEVVVLYEEAEAREKEALLKLNELQDKFDKKFLNFAMLSPKVRVNNSPVKGNSIEEESDNRGESFNPFDSNLKTVQPFYPLNSNLRKAWFDLDNLTVNQTQYGYENSDKTFDAIKFTKSGYIDSNNEDSKYEESKDFEYE